jgi:8-oxo-dGTP diphosphatase
MEVRVAGLWVRDGAVLLAQHVTRGERYWVVPGGHVEAGETLAQALIREFLEEVGVEVRVGAFVMFDDVLLPRRHGLDLYFAVEPAERSTEPQQIQTGSVRGVRFVSADGLAGLDVRPALAGPLAAYLRTGAVPQVYLGPQGAVPV